MSSTPTRCRTASTAICSATPRRWASACARSATWTRRNCRPSRPRSSSRSKIRARRHWQTTSKPFITISTKPSRQRSALFSTCRACLPCAKNSFFYKNPIVVIKALLSAELLSYMHNKRFFFLLFSSRNDRIKSSYPNKKERWSSLGRFTFLRLQGSCIKKLR